jgi:cytochrome c biogenesis protein CcmG, thiol:disulfide interchange protein DsbE
MNQPVTAVSTMAQHLYSIQMPRSGGGMVEFSKFKGRVLVIDFFTTWLNPSLVSVPVYVHLFEQYHSQGLEWVGVSLDEHGDQVVKPFIDVEGVTYPVAIASRGMREGHSVFGDLSAVPQLMVFDDQGQLVKVFVGAVTPEPLEMLLKELLRRHGKALP